MLERADYEVEHNGPIVPKPKLPQYDDSAGDQIFVTETGEEFVLEHVDESQNDETGDHIEIDDSNNEIDIVEYKPSVTQDGMEQASNHSRNSEVSEDLLQHDQPELEDDEHLAQL